MVGGEAVVEVGVGVQRLPVVVERGGLQDDAEGAYHAGRGEDPQEDTVKHHGHVLPVLSHLTGSGHMRGASWDDQNCACRK